MLELVSLNHQNFSQFIDLLRERGETPEDYYRWKYLDQPAFGKPTGFIAYLDNLPVGCIGVINRMYRAADGREFPSTWFADWFVKDVVRGHGVGQRLLEEVSKVSDYSFGIPGPLRAQEVAKRVGYVHQTFYDCFFLLRPLRYARLKFKKDSFFKSIFRRALLFLRFGRLFGTDNGGVFRELEVEDFKARLMDIRRSDSYTFSIGGEFVEWFARIPILPNGGKVFWELLTSKGKAVIGFKEVDNYGLVRATVLYVTGKTLDKETLRITLGCSKRHGIDYVIICLPDFDPKALSVSCYRVKPTPFTSLRNISIFSFPIDRENLWYSQQRFN